ncbi:MAG TPA: serine hydrolase [Gemmatimonadaceae bacterium]|nr:serine hydrolase [Gemmatimonadaceae bacterium]
MISPPQRTERGGASTLPSADALRQHIQTVEASSGALAVAIAVYDTASELGFRYRADRWFHAASTIKIAILLGVADAMHRGRLVPQSRLHVRNRFVSAYDGSAFRVLPDRDANAAVHDAVGKTMRISELALHMIATSSNLATNLLLDFIGLASVQRTIEALGIEGVDLRRGVEDERAFDHGIINRTTADGLVAMLRIIAEGRAFTPELSRDMLEILHRQEFRAGIPARLPQGTRVAHKTGDISTVAHDAGVVYPPGRSPYVVAILTEWRADAARRSATIAAISEAVYHHVLMGGTTVAERAHA